MPSRKLKYLGVIFHQNMTFGEHIVYSTSRATRAVTELSKIMPRLSGAGERKRRILASVAQSIMLYAAPVWEDAIEKQWHRQKLAAVQRLAAIRVSRAYRTVSQEALQVVASLIPIDLLVEERATRHRGECSKRQAREASMAKWQDRWEKGEKGAWTRRLIPDVKRWTERKHGETDYWLTQMLTGHGGFESYLHRMKRREGPECAYCPGAGGTAEHTFFECGRWAERRKQAEQRLGKVVSPENLVDIMLEDIRKWSTVREMVTDILKQKEREVAGRE